MFFGTKTHLPPCLFMERRCTIAIYHCSIKIISRGKGKSAVAAAAYRAGEKITNEYDGMIHDYTKKGGIVHTEILLSDHAPTEYQDRAVLWNAVEKIEKAKNSQLAREIEIALPLELTKEQNISLVREYVKQHFVDKGMCADFAIHDTNSGNPHADIMLTMRPFNEDKTWGNKQKKEYILDSDGHKIYNKNNRSYKCKSIPTTDWNEQTKAEDWRQGWAEICNRVLEQNNHTERIDHRSYERQGIDQIPTIHLGVAASAMEKRGIRTERGNINREIEVNNQRLSQLKARIVKLQNWLKEESTNTAQPTLADYIGDILSRKAQAGKSSRSQSLYNLKDASNMLNFLTVNKIMDVAGLDEKFKSIIGEQFDIRDKLKPIDRRLKTLDEHIKHSGNYKAYRGKKVQYDKLYAQYKIIKKEKGFGAERKAQKALNTANEYYENNRPQITLYESAERHLKGVLQERFDPKRLPPVAKWTAERDTLTAERSGLNRQYSKLKDEVKEAEQIRKSVHSILRQEQRNEQTIAKKRGMEL